MYCNNCGKHNPEGSKFCKSCGSQIIRVSEEKKTKNHIQAESTSSKKEDNKSHEKINAGLGGWLALVGIGLIVGIFVQGYGALEFLPLLSETYDIPGYLTMLQIEFIISIIFTFVTAYLLLLYFKKSKKFPQYYFTFLIASITFVLLDHLLLASLSVPTQEQQKIINDALSENTGAVGKTILTSTIWAVYIKTSKRVKATFINDK